MSEVQSPRGGVHIALWVVQVLLAFLFLMAGAMKLMTPTADLIAGGMAWAARFPEGFRFVVGGAEVLGAIGLIAPSATRILPVLTPAAAAGLVLTMLVAALDHVRAAEFAGMAPSVVLGLLSAFVVWGRAFGAKIPAR